MRKGKCKMTTASLDKVGIGDTKVDCSFEELAGMSSEELQRFLEEKAGMSPDEGAQGTLVSILVSIGYHC